MATRCAGSAPATRPQASTWPPRTGASSPGPSPSEAGSRNRHVERLAPACWPPAAPCASGSRRRAGDHRSLPQVCGWTWSRRGWKRTFSPIATSWDSSPPSNLRRRRHGTRSRCDMSIAPWSTTDCPEDGRARPARRRNPVGRQGRPRWECPRTRKATRVDGIRHASWETHPSASQAGSPGCGRDGCRRPPANSG